MTKGKNTSLIIASIFYSLVYTGIGIGIYFEAFTANHFWLLVFMPISVFAIAVVAKAHSIRQMIPGLAANVATNILFPVLLGMFLLLGT